MKELVLKILAVLFLIWLIAALLITGMRLLPDHEEKDEELDKQTEEVVEQKPVFKDDYVLYRFEQLKEMNPDFTGKLQVGQLIYECVVKSADNFDYLEKNLEMRPYGEGTVFMDYQNELDHHNLILYGHTIYSDETLRFGPLHQLLNQDQLEKNHQILFELEDETRIYEIVCVMHFDLNSDIDYAKTEYTEEEMNQYISYINEHNLIQTDQQITSQDYLLTLQTDVKDNPDVKLIVVAKQVNR